MRIKRVQSVGGVPHQDVVLDGHAIHRLPDDDPGPAVGRHDVVVHAHATHGVVAGDLQAVGGVGGEDVVRHQLVLAAQVESVVAVAARPPVVVHVVADVVVGRGGLARVDAVLAIGRVACAPVVVDMVRDQPVAVAVDRDAPRPAVADLEALERLLGAVQVHDLRSITGVLPVEDRPPPGLGLEHDRHGLA